MKYIAAIFLSMALTAQASEKEAIVSHGADLATTAVALDLPNVVEGNPLGIALIPMKVLMYYEIKKLPEEQQERGWNLMSAFGWGATANNVCIITTLNPACFVAGFAAGMYRWYSGEAKWEQEQFAKICEKTKETNSNLICEYKPS